MLDRLLGRATLKRRIEELESEAERLRERHDAESERRSEAVRERQAAEERVNRLEDRVADLEGQLERERSGSGDGPSHRGTERLRGERLSTVLDRLASVDAGPEGALTAYVAEDLPPAVATAFAERAAVVRRATPCLAVTDDAGLVGATLSVPAPPEPFCAWDDGFRIEREWFLPAGRHAFAVVRADLFALGEYDGDEHLDASGFESEVQGSHSKGGFSQRRFERRRDEQVEAHLEKCREALADVEAPLYVAGDERLIAEFADSAEATRAVDASGDPEDALRAARREFWSARLTLV